MAILTFIERLFSINFLSVINMTNVIDFRVEHAAKVSGINDKALIRNMVDLGYDPVNPNDVTKYWSSKKAADDLGIVDFDLVDFDSFMRNIEFDVVNVETDLFVNDFDFNISITYEPFDPDK